jgi:tetratricopeptide (TPR) repeat protein
MPPLSIFVSYTGADRSWAEWIAFALEAAGHHVVFQAWDFRPGSNFVLEMQKATRDTDRTVIVLSPRFLQAAFPQPEWAAAFAQDPKGQERRLVPVRIEACSPDGLLGQIVWIDLVGLPEDAARTALLQGLEERGKPSIPPLFPGVSPGNAAPFPGPASPQIALGRLPTPGPVFVGREVEITRLDAAWDDPAIHVISLVAFGGVGKSALVARWLDRMSAAGWRGAERVFAWSFYSQGTENQVTSAELFLDFALRLCGDPDPSAGSLHDRGGRLAGLIRQQRTLLILDGVEPLQYPPGPLEGKLKDPGLASLLKGLEAANPGLCVVTTRERITDLNPFQQTAPQLPLEELSPDDGMDLLRQLGVNGREPELQAAVAEFGRHALTLTLLGNYLKKAHGGDVRKRREVDLEKADERQGGHAFRVIAAYARWLGEGPELAILRLLGFFDRPADESSLAALRTKPAIPGLTEPLEKLAIEDWRYAIDTLREHGLLTAAEPGEPGTLDAHPLIRVYFAEELEQHRPEAWKEGNRRLYEHLQKVPPEYPDSLKEMQPLFAAVVHGCRGGRMQEALDEVYWRRIQRGDVFYSTKELGAIGSGLTALASFFDRPWARPSGHLTTADQAFMLNQAGFNLRALGRLAEAVEPVQAGLDLAVRREVWNNAARSAINLSELTLTLGDLPRTVKFGEQSVELAERSGEAFLKIANLTVWADALHQVGHREESSAAFREAEAMQAEWQPKYPRFSSIQGYLYCDLLLSEAEPEDGAGLAANLKAEERFREVLERGEYALRIAEQNRWFLDIALDHLTLGRAHLGLALTAPHVEDRDAERTRAVKHLNRAVDGLRQREDYLPRGLLARAAFRRLNSDFSGASTDLSDVLEIAERGPMRLYECDAYLELARLCRDQGQFDEARRHVERARELVEQTGYGRRRREVEYLGRCLPSKQ